MKIEFSFSRFWRLISSEMILRWKRFLFSVLGAFLILLVLSYLIVNPSSYNYQSREFIVKIIPVWSFFVLTYGALVGVLLGSAFRALRKKEQAIAYLMLPASHLEKYLLEMLTTFIPILVFPLFFLVTFDLAAWIRIQVIPTELDSFSLWEAMDSPDIWNVHYQMAMDKFYAVSQSLMAVVCVFFTGQSYFKKIPLIKSAVVTIAFIGIIILMAYLGLEKLGIGKYELPYGFLSDFYMGSAHTAPMVIAFCASIAVFTSLVAGYFNLKEKEA